MLCVQRCSFECLGCNKQLLSDCCLFWLIILAHALKPRESCAAKNPSRWDVSDRPACLAPTTILCAKLLNSSWCLFSTSAGLLHYGYVPKCKMVPCGWPVRMSFRWLRLQDAFGMGPCESQVRELCFYTFIMSSIFGPCTVIFFLFQSISCG